MPEVHVWRTITTTGVKTEEHSQSTTVFPQGITDMAGKLFIEWDLAGTFSFNLEGRPDSSSAFALVIQRDQADAGGGAGSVSVDTLPQMQINVTAIAGATITVWLME